MGPAWKDALGGGGLGLAQLPLFVEKLLLLGGVFQLHPLVLPSKEESFSPTACLLTCQKQHHDQAQGNEAWVPPAGRGSAGPQTGAWPSPGNWFTSEQQHPQPRACSLERHFPRGQGGLGSLFCISYLFPNPDEEQLARPRALPRSYLVSFSLGGKDWEEKSQVLFPQHLPLLLNASQRLQLGHSPGLRSQLLFPQWETGSPGSGK